MAAQHPTASYPILPTFDPSTEEIWYPIPSLPGYELSSDLRIRSWRAGRHRGLMRRQPRVRTLRLDHEGYLVFSVVKNGQSWPIKLHRVVAELAYGELPAGLCVRHANDDKAINLASNLLVGTQSDNVADAVRNGVTARCNRSRQAKLTAESVRELKRDAQGGMKGVDLARKYGVASSIVSRILTGKRWKHVTIGGR